MHPPFGFALFYLRSIAPKTVKTKDIYLGAIPWLGMQLILVAIIIFWPESVTYWLDKAPDVDLNTIKIEIPGFGNDSGNNQMPNFGLPPMDGAPGQGGGAQPAPGLPGMPNFGEPPKINP
jgi:hypothetical protein